MLPYYQKGVSKMSPEEIRRMIGRNIMNLRSEYGISRKSLAKLIKIPVNQLRRVESGDVNAKLFDVHLKRIGMVFGITVDQLYDGIPD